jgi:hypothetical protein
MKQFFQETGAALAFARRRNKPSQFPLRKTTSSRQTHSWPAGETSTGGNSHDELCGKKKRIGKQLPIRLISA